MEWNVMKKIVDKVDFYRHGEIVAHVLTIPKGTFKNGLFVSELKEDKYFWFVELGTSDPIRLFVSEIYDIQDYKMRKGDES